MSKSVIPWTDRTLLKNPYKIGICRSESRFKHELARLHVPRESWPEWLADDALACVHEFVKVDQGERCIIVCIGDLRGVTPLRAMGVLVHESVHIWQRVLTYIEERNPGNEIEAYSIESLVMYLFKSWGGLSVAKKGKGKH